MMKIQILGTGCPKCKKLLANTEQAIAELGLEAEIEKVTELKDIAQFGVMVTPALVVDGVLKTSGKVPNPQQLAKLLQ
jgi:small redox-active disulfide protein 2